ncbi:MAG: quinone oxidoreductase [Proteobacteria bacterium]|nr:quinone oxidoreductase [Pseudomonadota bacterium]HQR04164.1 quinone oxidoreductase [Rhodocyclaceae bacterium]
MPHAIRIHRTGGPEVMCWEDVNLPLPGPGEVRLRQIAVGLNYIDTYHRSGLYPLPLPSGLGPEGAGEVIALGAGVSDLRPGDRVAYPGGPLAPVGAYAEERNIAAAQVVKIPEGISCETAAAMMLRGCTVQYLLRRTYRVRPGDTVLIHAAAGGVGLIACQWAKALGATVIGTVGSDAKAALAQAHGCDHAIVYTREDFVARVREITGGQGVPVVYDAVGRDTFTGSLDCLQPLGLMVSFGNASGPVPPVDLLDLSRRGSLFITRPTLFTHIARHEDLLASAGELFDMVLSGKVSIEVGQRYPLREAARAHADIEARRTVGSTLLLP